VIQESLLKYSLIPRVTGNLNGFLIINAYCYHHHRLHLFNPFRVGWSRWFYHRFHLWLFIFNPFRVGWGRWFYHHRFSLRLLSRVANYCVSYSTPSGLARRVHIFPRFHLGLFTFNPFPPGAIHIQPLRGWHGFDAFTTGCTCGYSYSTPSGLGPLVLLPPQVSPVAIYIQPLRGWGPLVHFLGSNFLEGFMAAIKVDVPELIEILRLTPPEQNIMLIGKHGLGKSQIIAEFYKRMKVIAFFLGQMSDPGDLIGLMYQDQKTGHSEFLPPYWWPTDNKPIVLFLDELNRARPEILQ